MSRLLGLIFCFLIVLGFPGRLAGQSVLFLSPPQNALAVPRTHDISVQFTFSVDPASVNSLTFVVRSSQRGIRTGALESIGRTVTFNPHDAFDFGERVAVTLTRGIRSVTGDSLQRPYSWEFIVQTIHGTGQMPLDQIIPLGTDGIGSLDDITHADIDQDGDVDLIEADPTSGYIHILRNNNGVFSVSARLDLGGTLPHEVGAADLNGDTYPDLIVISAALPTLTTWLNDGAGNFTRAYEGNYSIGDGFTFADLNGDGITDVAVMSQYSHETVIFLGTGNGTFVEGSRIAVVGQSMTEGDYDGNGTIDLAEGGADGSLHILLNDGRAQFTQLPAGSTGGYTYSMASADMDGDGNLDLVICNRQERSVSVGINDGSGHFTLLTGPNTGAVLAHVAVGDLDADGDIDVVASGGSQSALLVNDGHGHLTMQATLRQSEAATIADFNNDGDLDVAFASNFSDDVAIYRNNNPPFLAHPLSDVTLLEDGGPLTLVSNLYSVFSDVDRDNLIFTASTPGAGITLSTASDSLVLFTAPDSFGVFTVAVVASDSFSHVADTLVVTVLPVNDAPHPPVLIFPGRGDTISTRDSLTFLWHTAFDVEHDPLSYFVHLLKGERDSLLTMTRDTCFALAPGVLMKNEPYSWFVVSFDGSLGSPSDTVPFRPMVPLPRAFSLLQNYPNPFNPVTVIRYDLPVATNVTLVIYSPLGQEVRTLVNDDQPAGEQSALWDGTNNHGLKVGSGMYIYRIQCAGFSTAKKLMILR